MTTADIITEVLAGQRVSASRPRILTVLNFRYWNLLALEEWTFMKDTRTVTVTSGSNIVTGTPTPLGIVTAIYNDQGSQLESLEPDAFYADYYADTSSGYPDAFTVIEGQVLLGPLPNVSSTSFLMLSELEATPLTDDTSTPLTPTGSHLGLVAGVEAFMIGRENDPTAQGLEQIFQGSIDAMRRRYLVAQRGQHDQMGAWAPGC